MAGLQPFCFDQSLEKIQAPHGGKNTYKNTESWRCPNVDAISRSIRKVAQCYLNRGGQENRKKAVLSLNSVENLGFFYRCLSAEERNSFLSDLNSAKATTL